MSEQLHHGQHGEPVAASEAAAVGEPLKARGHAEAHHPGPREYVKIGMVLAIITALEVAVYYVDALRDQLVVILLLAMTVKFLIVVRSFMHLKFDNPGYGRMFITGITLAIAVYTVVLATFGIFVK